MNAHKLAESDEYIKVIYRDDTYFFPIFEETKPVHVKRFLTRYTNRKICDMKLVVYDLGEVSEVKRSIRNTQTFYLLLRNPETQKFEKLEDYLTMNDPLAKKSSK